MSILKVLGARLESMTQADRQIAQFVIDHPERMLTLSSQGLAEATGRSQSSVVKFSQKMGYAGYQQLKLAVNQAKALEWQAPGGIIHGSIDISDSYMMILQKLIGSKLLSMRETTAANNEQTIDRALDALSGARKIQLAGVGASSLVARDFSYKLLKLGRAVLVVTSREFVWRDLSLDWLVAHDVPHEALYMRIVGDYRKDVVIKKEILQQIADDGFTPLEAWDDKESVLELWRDNGIVTHAVG